ncbi:bifunctional methylenetetrahydrofolate dehydrogenase/methenyltetrahydrofolate cyclohydrolase FolD [Pseudomonas kurunegalensis]|uniref:bifunctional methylenetetrahydrofolate dehydrogenase/methenyltetrahydrofolate cyclohydrolase FolD n=1 Tax=Pseudomonas kurunegalensis TaxID=485880 RepID=UPI002570F20B|nr:bifunctional methylenetetrahydrofolate dehydrogenase/methenyltetrahydrofolate cyclohydrolase FolD [Pseudomonas kurunegalensis]WJD65146.1 bifunctional methylenetetrahydrofolate dehydrogenase/methenyltetrahydrofolate cyclohydrolase FolD [Pseudomonas kurunegalensis]
MTAIEDAVPSAATGAALIDGKAFAEALRGQVAQGAEQFARSTGQPPGLAVVLVGDDPASQVYVRTKMKTAADTGIRSFPHLWPGSTSQSALLELIRQLNEDPQVHGILVQLPLPAHLDEAQVIAAISPAKDVDGFHPINVGRLSQGTATLIPCTPLGCLLLLKDRLGDLSGLKAVVVGRSNIVGKPMANLLLQANCTVTILHSRSRNLEDECRQADILVLAVGAPRKFGAGYIKPGATVIDVGINRIVSEDGKSRLVGDADTDAVSAIAGAVTPVPGGVGPMTVACLLKNTLTAASAAEGLAFD